MRGQQAVGIDVPSNRYSARERNTSPDATIDATRTQGQARKPFVNQRPRRPRGEGKMTDIITRLLIVISVFGAIACAPMLSPASAHVLVQTK